MESKFGEKLIVSIKGGSHEPAVNVSIKGLPEGFLPDMERLQTFLDRRAPGRSELTSSRREEDIPRRLDDGTSREMLFEIKNSDIRRADYDSLRNIPRPGHADYTARLRYGDDIDMSGGGPFSGRMTVALCLAGGLALQLLEERGIRISARLLSAGGNPDIETAIREAADEGDSVGGLVECVVQGIPGGIGDAMYGGLESRLSPVLFGIPAVKGLEFGAGFKVASMKGSENNDAFYCDEKPVNGELPRLKTRTNNCGGILGGITDGMPLVCRVAFKPTPSIAVPQESVDLRTGESADIVTTGRHDPCVALRALPAVEAAVALGMLDAILVTESRKGISSRGEDSSRKLARLRARIDDTDDELLELLETRMKLSGQISSVKQAAGLPFENLRREEEILDCVGHKADPAFAPYAVEFFREIFAMSKKYQRSLVDQLGYGLIGHPLSHSFSKEIHEALGRYSFHLFDLTPEEMQAFVRSRRFSGLTVTRPYKQAVIPMCDALTPRAGEIGAVNTLYFDEGRLIGHNTDYDGFLYTALRSGIDFVGKIVLILGSGGTSRTVYRVCADRGAAAILFASRGEGDGKRIFNYDRLPDIAEQIEIIVNTTPAGTYPENLNALISLGDFPACEAVIDVVYNPFRTALLMEADSMGLKTANGMPMLVAQAMAAADKFLGKAGELTGKTEQILRKMEAKMGNIVLIGMPGCGKSAAARKLAAMTGRTCVDLDDEIAAETGIPVPDLLNRFGEAFFRKVETLVACRVGREHGQIIASGGGIVLREENYRALKQNGTFIWLKRPIHQLATDGRPLSKDFPALEKIAHERYKLYGEWADYIINSDELM